MKVYRASSRSLLEEIMARQQIGSQKHGAALINIIKYLFHVSTVSHLSFCCSVVVYHNFSKMTKISIKHPPTPTLAKVKMTVKKVHQKPYRQYDAAYLFDCLIEYVCMSDGTSITAFLKTKEKISKTSFLRFYNKSGLADLKQKGSVDVGIAKLLLTKYFEKTVKNSSDRTAAAHASCHYLTDNEEHSLVRAPYLVPLDMASHVMICIALQML